MDARLNPSRYCTVAKQQASAGGRHHHQLVDDLLDVRHLADEARNIRRAFLGFKDALQAQAVRNAADHQARELQRRFRPQVSADVVLHLMMGPMRICGEMIPHLG